MRKQLKKLSINTSKLRTDKTPYYSYLSFEEEYFKNGEIRAVTKYNSDGNIESKQIYTLNDNVLIKEIVNYEKGDLIERIEFLDNLEGELMKEITTYSDNSKRFVEYHYNKENYLIETIGVEEDKSIFKRKLFEYDSLGREIIREIFDEENKLSEKSLYEYLEEKYLLTKQVNENYVFDEYNVLTTTYNMYDQMLTEHRKDRDGKLTGEAEYFYKGENNIGWKSRDVFNGITTIYEIDYDNSDNPIKESQMINGVTDFYIERKYENGLIIEEEEFTLGNYNESNNLLVHEFIYEYFE